MVLFCLVVVVVEWCLGGVVLFGDSLGVDAEWGSCRGGCLIDV